MSSNVESSAPSLAEAFAFVAERSLAVVASVAADRAPQAAVVGFALTDRFELVFDTLGDTRKIANLRRDERIALVVGWDRMTTVQLEGVADEPTGAERERILARYLEAFPDGRERLAWSGITHVRVRPRWLRYSDFRASPPRILEADARALDDHFAAVAATR